MNWGVSGQGQFLDPLRNLCIERGATLRHLLETRSQFFDKD